MKQRNKETSSKTPALLSSIPFSFNSPQILQNAIFIRTILNRIEYSVTIKLLAAAAVWLILDHEWC
ncbi:hypothetical protein DERP_013844 [Dermatophagoides pteronyssinus]|uniref:Uncharacterized protein n=1 Tax=Dermatophagoides pteronyssinus TaxID=6956 RepID=A0ABQ8J2U7_DERPT|nr:hypothetical protein DERP_013844 [Dermatophagoides pteronyssinus]